MPSKHPRPSGRRKPDIEELDALARLYSQGLTAEAETLSLSLTTRFPKHGFGWKVLGAIYQGQQRFEDSCRATQQAIALLPDDAATHNNLGTALLGLQRLPEAEISIRKALAIAPDYAKALNNLGTLLRLQGKLPEAEAYCRRALTIEPGYTMAHLSLGNALELQNKTSEAIASYRAALALNPDLTNIHSDMLHLLSHDVHVDAAQLQADHWAFGKQFDAPLHASRPSHDNSKDATRRLQVGFVASDLHNHALANYLEPLFKFLALKSALSLHLYHTNSFEDTVTLRMRGYFAHWNPVATLAYAGLANKIRSDKIDILIDLNGHTFLNRLLTFAQKPAPVQVSWLGYLGTTGLQAMDYYVCDPYWMPPGEMDWQFTEKLAYLPAAVVFQPNPLAPPVNLLPALKNGHITFGSFNRLNKINQSVIALWSMLLRNIPDSRLVLGAIPPEHQDWLWQSFEEQGIARSRLSFFARVHQTDYLALHHQVDFCLDTFPFGGGATTAHAAWMGVPTLCLAGDSPASRFGATEMHHLGLDEFVASSIEDFVAKGCYWAEHLSELADIRQGMRARFNASALGQAKRFADNFEAMLRMMWARWCNDLPPASITVEEASHGDALSAPLGTADPAEQDLATLIGLHDQQRHEEAESLARRLISECPEHGLAWKILGSALRALGRLKEAMEVHQLTAQLRPHDYEAHFNLAYALQHQGQFDEAVKCYIAALGLQPNNPAAYNNLGNIFKTMGLFAEAETYCRQAITLLPTMENAHNNLGNALHAQGKYAQAQASFQQALALRPDWADAYNNLAITLKDRGYGIEAQEAYRTALRLKPEWAAAHSNLLYCLSLDVHTPPQELHAQHLAFGEQFEAPLRAGGLPHGNTKNPQRRLQIGFVSGDLYDHALTNFLEPLFTPLAKQAGLELHAYYTHIYDDAVTQRLRASFAHWHPVAGLAADALADRIRADGIDILIDLCGHTAHNRLLTFARKPAPVQASWLGYLGTTGLQAMDYYLCDTFWVQPGELDWQFTEKPAYLPAAVVFQPSELAPPVNPLPALANGHITFGSFNRPNKLNASVIVLWAMLLRDIPSARMVLGGIPPESQAEMQRSFAREGIEHTRLSFFARSNLPSYLALHHQVDFCLDTFPYGGGATNAHAAWMGVPTLCLAGDTPASRFGATEMNILGLHGFIASSIEDYLAKGRYWAEHVDELAVIRLGMRERFNSSALGQPALFAENFSALLRTMWQRWCSDLPAAPIEASSPTQTLTINAMPAPAAPSAPSEQQLATLKLAYDQQRYADAEGLSRVLLERFPVHGFAWKMLATIYQTQGQYEASIPALQQAIALEPQDAALYNNLGTALSALDRHLGAESYFRQAIAIAPDYGKALVNLGMALRLQGRLQESESCCRRALEIDACDASAHIQLGNALEDQGQLSEAQACYYRADMAHEPRRAVAHSNVLYLLNHDVLVEPTHLFAEHVAFGDQFEAALRTGWQGHSNLKNADRKLKIGFVSGDFHHHALNEFLEPAFKALAARPNLTLYAYSNGTRDDEVTRRTRKYFAHWSAVAHLSDEDLATQIRADAIDILIDLSGHTAKNRLLTFARKPAPIQMSWLGYLGTTGLQAMDYYLCDRYWIPPGEMDWQFTEKLAYLPNAVVFQPDPLAPPVNALPALRNGYITFGSFNRVTKINDSVMALWSMVMQQVPTSKLVLAGIEVANQPTIAATFAEHGIDATRLKFYPRLATAEYLALHQQVDFCLDTFPHGGGATTAHAAWMGVPTLCLAGETPASRFSASLMHHVGLDSFVAGSIEEFVERGVAWAGQIEELARLRTLMRQQFAESPLGQPEKFAQSVEATLREAWKHWCESTMVATIRPPQQPSPITRNTSMATNTLADALVNLAQDNEDSGNRVAAACLYAEALKLTPEDAQLNYRLGLIEVTLKGAVEALPRFEAAVQFQPNEESHWVAYIDALIQTGALETAASALEWGQKYGLRAATAETIAANCVAALEKKLNPPPIEAVSAYTADELAWPPAPPWPAARPSLTAKLDYIHPPASASRRYVIYAPFYRHNSAGIRVLYDLQKWLVLAGYDAIVIAAIYGYATEQFAEDIVIYPEVVVGNPLKARRVVRYILNVPGKIGGTKSYAGHELLVAYSEPLAAHAHGKILNLPTIEPFFCKTDGPKPKLAVYVGKGADLKLHPEECIYITRDFPSSRRGVATLLQQVSTLYTYDDFTAIELEALLCGCEVKVIRKGGEIADLQNSFLNSQITPIQDFKAQLHDFIEMTKLL
jgi:predicted O-linked N-acetylglucosamine transferase (SPINDLY family)